MSDTERRAIIKAIRKRICDARQAAKRSRYQHRRLVAQDRIRTLTDVLKWMRAA